MPYDLVIPWFTSFDSSIKLYGRFLPPVEDMKLDRRLPEKKFLECRLVYFSHSVGFQLLFFVCFVLIRCENSGEIL